jgi:hypothetical protein
MMESWSQPSCMEAGSWLWELHPAARMATAGSWPRGAPDRAWLPVDPAPIGGAGQGDRQSAQRGGLQPDAAQGKEAASHPSGPVGGRPSRWSRTGAGRAAGRRPSMGAGVGASLEQAGAAGSRPRRDWLTQGALFLLCFTDFFISFATLHLLLIREVLRARKLEDFVIPGVIPPTGDALYITVCLCCSDGTIRPITVAAPGGVKSLVLLSWARRLVGPSWRNGWFAKMFAK